MSKEKIEVLVDGGKASAAPPLGSSLGPIGVNIGQVVAEINKKTEAFKGMKVPVKILIDKETKEFTITIGTPPVSQLIKKELNLQKGAGIPNKDKVANIAVEQMIKIAKMKQGAMFVNSLTSAVKNVAGSCNAMGVLIEGKTSTEIVQDINHGIYDDLIKNEKTEVSSEKIIILSEQLNKVQLEFKKELERLKSEKEAEKPAEEVKEAEVAKEATVKPELKKEEKKK